MSLEEGLSAAARPDSKIPGRRNTVMILESEDLPVIKYCVTTRTWSVQKCRYPDVSKNPVYVYYFVLSNPVCADRIFL